MFEALFEHYVKTHNCSVYQDKHMSIKLSRLTPAHGAVGFHQVLWDKIELPQQGKFYHLFKLGQINPRAVALLQDTKNWTRLSSACQDLNLFANVYSSTGLELARSMVYFKTLDGSNVIFAIEHHLKNAFHPGKTDTYLRVYQNAYYNRDDSNAASDVIAVRGGYIQTSQVRQALIDSFNTYNSMLGECFCTVNGYRVNALNTNTVKIGDIAEFIFDGSVYKVVDFAVTNLRSFVSSLDKRAKYVLHYDGADSGQIDYCDDCDIYVIDSVTQKGVYYYQHLPDSIRNLTHRDYSVCADYVSSYFEQLNSSSSTAVLRLYVRNSGLDNPVLGQMSRIRDMYLMSDSQIRQTLIGLSTSSLNIWKAQSLEASQYMRLMSADPSEVTAQQLASAYGYDELAYLFASPCVNTEFYAGRLIARVPLIMQQGSTVFEYGPDGKLIAYYPNVPGDDVYYCQHAGVTHVEYVLGTGQYLRSDAFADTVNISSTLDYRCYEKINDVWKDVTGTSNYTALPHSSQANVTVITWQNAASLHFVRTSAKHLLYSFDLTTTLGTYEFNLTQQLDVAGNIETLYVPRGNLDIYLNGGLLIEGIDYILDFPRVSIVSKQHLLADRLAAQKVVVCYSGFCNTDLTHSTNVTSGYIQNDMLGHNAVYDLTYRRPLRFNVAGSVKMQSQVKLAETSSDFIQQSPNNGLPYCIKTTDTSFKKMLPGTDTRQLQLETNQSRQAISDYLTLKLGEPDTNQINIIQRKYYLFSPFFCKVLVELRSGAFDAFKDKPIDPLELRQACAHLFDTYRVDPLYSDNKPNPNFCEVHLTSSDELINVSQAEYRILAALVALYGNGLIELSAFVRVV